MKRAVLAAVLAVGALPLAGAGAEAPFRFDAAPGRLPKGVVPVDYRIAVVPDVAARTFSGSETVVLRVRRPSATIVFNTLDLTLRDARVDGVPVATIATRNREQLTTLGLARPLAPGRHVLAVRYDGKLGRAPAGLFVQPYRTPAGRGVMLSTQFESTDARRMFPCWDEPAFRATFELTATLPARWAAVSNMPVASRRVTGSLATTTFRRTPSMPAYLLELSAGDLRRIAARADGVEHGVWTIAGRERFARTALAISQRILADYDGYFGYRYPLPKLDHIGIPGGFSGAMENWGAITYTDQTLLDTPGAGAGREETIFSIMAHEMAHQWNGDLVTMGWWDDIWLNESFASWMSTKETALRNPSWQWLERADGAKESAMDADARLSSHPIQQHVADELQAEASFDQAITYDKGEAVLRMLEAYLGPATFRDGIRRYVRAHAYSNATSADLWNALSAASGRDVAAVASGWTAQAGFPLVEVRASCDAGGDRTLTLAQQRFLLAGGDSAKPRWRIPLRIRSGAAGTPRTVLFAGEGQTVAAGRCGEPLSVNAGALGYYRAAYDDATLAADRAAFGTLPDGDRIALLDDQWALARAGRAPLGTFLGLASAMGGDLDLRAWQRIFDALQRLESGERDRPGHAAFLAYARGVARPVATALGWDPKPHEPEPDARLRAAALTRLGEWGDPGVVAEARARFARFLADRGALSPDQQAIVFDVVAANADAATFDRLHALVTTARDGAEMRRALFALAEVRDPALAARVLRIATSPEIPPQAAFLRGHVVFAVARLHPRLAWNFFREHAAELMATESEFERALFLAQDVPAIFRRAAPLPEIEAWLKEHVAPSLARYEARGLETAREAQAEESRLDAEADRYTAGQAASTTARRTDAG